MIEPELFTDVLFQKNQLHVIFLHTNQSEKN
jgi:hypothetical protein